jgi:hypothetical protein
MAAAIKNPTLRKVVNRGFEPVSYRLPNNQGGQVVNCWIHKRGRKLLHIHIIGVGNRRVPKTEERFMLPLA